MAAHGDLVQSRGWRFGNVTLDSASFQLAVDGTPRDLEPKSFRVLLYLIENRDRAVTKDEIFQAVWNGVAVTDNALSRAITQIRKALGDEARNPKYIETVPTIGYRFVGTAEPLVSIEPAPPEPSQPPRRANWKPAAAIAILTVLIAAAAAISRRPAAPKSGDSQFLPVQFSTSSGLDIGGSFSPDGTWLAYVSDKTGSFEIFLRGFDPGSGELQLTKDGNQNIDPAFSPDGNWIAYSSMRRKGIYRIPAIGGTPQRLTEFGAQPVWSPDGRNIVFRSSGSASFSTTDSYSVAPESDLYSVPATGGSLTRITGTPGSPEGGASFPTFNRDGSEIRFIIYNNGEAGVWSYKFADRTFRKRFSSESLKYSNAIFSADDTRMWFIDAKLNGNVAIMQLSLDPATLTPHGEPERISGSQFVAPRDLALSRDGKRLSFSSVAITSAIYAQPLAGARSEPQNLVTETAYRWTMLRSSPDGSLVVSGSFPRNGRPRGWIVNADGSNARLIGPDTIASFPFGITADDSRVFLSTSESPKQQQSRLISQRLSDKSIVDHGPLPPGNTQWTSSPDGRLIAYHNDRETPRRIHLRDIQSGEERIIQAQGQHISFPWFSRDGKFLRVQVRRSDRYQDALAVMPVDGDAPEIILSSNEPTYGGAFLPDNDQLLFAASRDGVWNAYSISRRTKETKQLTFFKSPRTYVRYPDWLKGDRLVYEFNEAKGNIYLANLP